MSVNSSVTNNGIPKISINNNTEETQPKDKVTRFKVPSIATNSRSDPYKEKSNATPMIIQQPGCSTLNPNPRGGGLAKLSGARQKVRLAPGHSALDWNDLNKKIQMDKSRSNELLYGLQELFTDETQFNILKRINSDNVDTVVKLKQYNIPCYLLHPPLRINEQLLKCHQKNEHEFWTVIHGNVYCIGSYMEFHPGGTDVLTHYGERFADVGFWFNKFHRWVNYEKLLQNCYIGKFVKDK